MNPFLFCGKKWYTTTTVGCGGHKVGWNHRKCLVITYMNVRKIAKEDSSSTIFRACNYRRRGRASLGRTMGDAAQSGATLRVREWLLRVRHGTAVLLRLL